ncbi:MAG: hypothetical protein RSB76_03300, partial [Clostridia bacterium]
NNEFGSTIEMIKKRNVQEYNIHLIYSKITSEFYITNYTLKKHSKCIYFKDVDQDILNINYVAYEKYRIEILKVLRQMNIKKDNFSKNKLGALCKKVYDI